MFGQLRINFPPKARAITKRTLKSYLGNQTVIALQTMQLLVPRYYKKYDSLTQNEWKTHVTYWRIISLTIVVLWK